VVFFPRRLGTIGTADNNAFFAPAFGGFGILRENGLADLPLAANEGVLAHELSHAIFGHVSGPLTAAIVRDNDVTAAYELGALNEGIADVHAAAVTGDPEFMRPSFATVGPGVAERRNLATRRSFTADLDATLYGVDYDPYAVGSVFASAFWAFRTRVAASLPADASRIMAQLALDATRRLGALEATPERRTTLATPRPVLEAFVRYAVEEAAASGRGDDFCAVARDQLAVLLIDARVCP
jgi:hypothetical protein